MKIKNIKIINFRNFKNFEIETGEQVIIIGENKIGKSNLLYALRLILDPYLPDAARELKETDFWDGIEDPVKNQEKIEIAVELTGFDNDMNEIALLADSIIEINPIITSKLTYIFRPKLSLDRNANSLNDYEFIIYGGNKIENRIGYETRKRIPLLVLNALRDTENDLRTWYKSPLKPLLEEASAKIDRNELNKISSKVKENTKEILDLEEKKEFVGESQESTNNNSINKPFRDLEYDIEENLIKMVGKNHSLKTILGFLPLDQDKLFRSICLLIDDGKRTINEASLGSTNILYLVLKTIELNQLVEKGKRDHTFFAIEEPEAHLHPHLQRLIYREYFKNRSENNILEKEAKDNFRTTILTTHSPYIISVSPIKSMILLKSRSEDNKSFTIGTSIKNISISDKEIMDFERYLDISRGEILFSKGIIFVEGTTEKYIIPTFANILGKNLDKLGISVCSIEGTNFIPYVKLFGKRGFDIPFVIITDWDPKENSDKSLGKNRIIKLLKLMNNYEKLNLDQLKNEEIIKLAKESGIFTNEETFEKDFIKNGGKEAVCNTFVELNDGKIVKKVDSWSKNKINKIECDEIYKYIESIGKGRFAQRLIDHLNKENCPNYVKEAIEYAERNVQ